MDAELGERTNRYENWNSYGQRILKRRNKRDVTFYMYNINICKPINFEFEE